MRRALALTALLPGLLAGCGGGGTGTTPAAAPPDTPTLALSSSAFPDGGTIPKRYTCSGQNISPPLAWGKPPAGTGALVLTVIDPDAPGSPYGHWGVVLLADQRALSAGQQTGTSVKNSGGKPGYTGPCPPPGDSPHHYMFTLYAVKKAPQADTVTALNAAAAQAPLAVGKLTGLFGR